MLKNEIYIMEETMYTNLSSSAIIRSLLISKFKYRDRANIVVDILDAVKTDPKGKTKTSIMRRANLNLRQVNTYLELLIVLGFLKTEDPIRSQEMGRYKLTRKGLDFALNSERARSILK